MLISGTSKAEDAADGVWHQPDDAAPSAMSIATWKIRSILSPVRSQRWSESHLLIPIECVRRGEDSTAAIHRDVQKKDTPRVRSTREAPATRADKHLGRGRPRSRSLTAVCKLRDRVRDDKERRRGRPSRQGRDEFRAALHGRRSRQG